MSWEIILFEELPSTNDVARDFGLKGSDRLVVVADRQSRGRGRRGRPWFSPPRRNLYFSVLIRPPGLHVEDAGVFTMLTSLSLLDVVEPLGVSPWIKWPNDLYVEDRKLSGILNEVFPDGKRVRFIVLGIGLNVNGSFEGTELEEVATSVFQETGKEVDRMAVLLDFLEVFDRRVKEFYEKGPGSVREEWIERSGVWGKRLVVDGRVVKPVDIDEKGFLLVDDGERRFRVGAGDIFVCS